MPATPEKLAYELSRATFDGQAETGKRLRDRAATVLSAASLVIPVAGIAVRNGSAWVAVPFGAAALAYGFCAYFCGRALLPREFGPGIAGGAFLDFARSEDASLPEMYVWAATYLDETREANSTAVTSSADWLEVGIRWLIAELVLLAAALVVTIVV